MILPPISRFLLVLPSHFSDISLRGTRMVGEAYFPDATLPQPRMMLTNPILGLLHSSTFEISDSIVCRNNVANIQEKG